MLIKFNNHLLISLTDPDKYYYVAITKQHGTIYSIYNGCMGIGYYQKKYDFHTIRFDNSSNRILFIGRVTLDFDTYQNFIKSILIIMYSHYYYAD